MKIQNRKKQIQEIIDKRLEKLRKLRKSSKDFTDRMNRDFVIYYAIREIEDLKINILNNFDN